MSMPKKLTFTKGKVLHINLDGIGKDDLMPDFYNGLAKISATIGARKFPVTAVSVSDISRAHLSLWEVTRLAALFKDKWGTMKACAMERLDEVYSFVYPHDEIMPLCIYSLWLRGVPTHTINACVKAGCYSIGEIFEYCDKIDDSAKGLVRLYNSLDGVMNVVECTKLKQAIILRARETHKPTPEFTAEQEVSANG